MSIHTGASRTYDHKGRLTVKGQLIPADSDTPIEMWIIDDIGEAALDPLGELIFEG